LKLKETGECDFLTLKMDEN